MIVCFQTSDDEPSEDKDLFVAQLYKFMDDRGMYYFQYHHNTVFAC